MHSSHTGLRRSHCVRQMWIVLAMMAGLFVGNSTAATLLFSVDPLGGNLYRYAYTARDFTLLANQEIAIEFDPLLFGDLSQASGGPGVLAAVVDPILDPDGLGGAPGRFSALALIDNPPLYPFEVTVAYLGSGEPGSLPFSINLFDSGQHFQEQLYSGDTVAATPEPAVWQMTALGLLIGGAFLGVLRRRKITT